MIQGIQGFILRRRSAPLLRRFISPVAAETVDAAVRSAAARKAAYGRPCCSLLCHRRRLCVPTSPDLRLPPAFLASPPPLPPHAPWRALV